jgi:hypothetical protein
MNLIRIDGTEETVRGLTDIPDIILVLGDAERLPDGLIRTSAYATDRAIGVIESRGATIERLLDNEQFAEHTAAVFEPPIVG